MLRSYLITNLTFFSFVCARSLTVLEKIALLAHHGRRDDNETTSGVRLRYFGCDGINPRTDNKYSVDLSNTWDEVIDIASSIKDIDLHNDIAAVECE
jgi:hypothetical protein